jgi:hypothetical protein
MDQRFKIDRHTVAALWLPAALCGFIVLGSPTLIRFCIALLVAATACVALVWQMRVGSEKKRPLAYDLFAQIVVVSVVSGIVWIVGHNSFHEILPYRHALIPLAAATSIALVLGAAMLTPLFRWPVEKSEYGKYLPRTELFLSSDRLTPPLSLTTFLTGAAAAAVRAPLVLLTLPAIATLIAPPAWIPFVPIAAGTLSLVALLLAGLNYRFATMWALFQESLFNGGALLVSLVVVVLAVLRLSHVTYVTTIFDSAAWWTIATVFASVYVLSWWFDYWSQRMLTDRLLRLMKPDACGLAQIPYEISPCAKATSVPLDGRALQVHGAGRYMVHREAYNADGFPRFQAHVPQQLFELLATHGAPGGKAIPSPGQIASRMASYRAFIGLVFVGIVGSGVWVLHIGVQLSQVNLKLADPGVALQSLLVPEASGPEDPLMIVVAASGGGTRAAVYTAAVLEGIAQQGKGDRILLGSGVSGGGAALAYFAGHRQALVDRKHQAWDKYFDTMTKPFIQDVMQRATEWHMVSSGRLGTALSDSFVQGWGLERSKLADVKDMGLILNTALAGHFERPSTAPAGEPLYAVERDGRGATTSVLAGGRLLLTNLSFTPMLVSPSIDPDTALAKLPVVIRSPQLRLEEAAALNANFPPVFSNAAIDVNETTRYWVTDGGTVDNRGIEMALYALREALKQVEAKRLPRLHIIVADASAFSSAYSQDRGISTLAGAGSRYASHLNAELVQALRGKYAEHPDRLTFSYVMMPDILRKSGSFGTHWMLQDTIEVDFGRDTVTLSGREMVAVIRALHSGDGSGLSADACRVLIWSRQDSRHREGWTTVLKALGGSDKIPVCSADKG